MTHVTHVMTITSATLVSSTGTVATYTLPLPLTIRPGDSVTITYTINEFEAFERRAYDPSRDELLPEDE